MKITLQSILFFLILFVSMDLYATDGKGMEYFKEAYRIEKTNPAGAASLYRQAIGEGLEKKLYNAARWRLFYIYKELDEFENAILLLNTFGQGKEIENIRRSLVLQIAYYYGIPSESAENFAAGLALNRSNSEKSFLYFQSALSSSKKNYRLRNDIVKILIRNGRDSDASQIFRIVAETPIDEMISRADILIGRKNYQEARSILYNLSVDSYNLTDEQKYKILYLLGKIEKGQNNEHIAVVYFRQAFRYERKNGGIYSAALSAYSLYKQGNSQSAYGLLKDFPLSNDSNIELLQLILLIEVADDRTAFERLKTREEALKNDSGFLPQQALNLLEKRK